MKLTVTMDVADGGVSRSSVSELSLDTTMAGCDPNVVKGDFLSQAEALVHAVSENQLPALYQAVAEEAAKSREESRQRQEEQA